MRIGFLRRGDDILYAMWVRLGRGRVAFITFGDMLAVGFARGVRP